MLTAMTRHIRESLDGRRRLAVGLFAVAFVLFTLLIAVLPEPPPPPAGYFGAAGAAIGAAIRGLRTHQNQGVARAFGWAIANALAVLAPLVAAVALASVLRPLLARSALPAEAVAAIAVSAFVSASVGALLWERDADRRRTVALTSLAFGVLATGFVLLLGGGSLMGLGAVAVLLAVAILLVAIALDRHVRFRLT